MKSALCCISSGSSLLAKVKGWNDMLFWSPSWRMQKYTLCSKMELRILPHSNIIRMPQISLFTELNGSDCLCTDTWWHKNIHISCSLHASCMCMVQLANKCASMFERISKFHASDDWGTGTYTFECRTFRPRTFGLGRFGPDISATDVWAAQNAKGGRFGQIIIFGLGFVHA